MAAARAVAAKPPAQRVGFARQMIMEAHAAHCYFKRKRRPHPKWGNGSLMARALGEEARTGGLGDLEILDGFSVVAISLAARKRGYMAQRSGTVSFCAYMVES